MRLLFGLLELTVLAALLIFSFGCRWALELTAFGWNFSIRFRKVTLILAQWIWVLIYSQ